jgi:predicted Zn-dependent protease
MAYGYERLGQLEKARLAYEQVVLRAQKQEPTAHLGLASIALQKGDVENAARSLDAARAAWGSSAPSQAWYHYAGLEAMMRGDASRAASVLAEGVEKYSGSAVLLANLSAAYEACGNMAEAAEAKRRSRASAGSAAR